MPHVTIEYSANLAARVGPDALVQAVHAAALGTGLAPVDALRTRAVVREHFRVGDGDPRNGFVAVIARLAVGRTPAQQQEFISALMMAVQTVLGSAAERAMLSVEYQEINPAMRININNLRTALANTAGDADGR